MNLPPFKEQSFPQLPQRDYSQLETDIHEFAKASELSNQNPNWFARTVQPIAEQSLAAVANVQKQEMQTLDQSVNEFIKKIKREGLDSQKTGSLQQVFTLLTDLKIIEHKLEELESAEFYKTCQKNQRTPSSLAAVCSHKIRSIYKAVTKCEYTFSNS